MIIPVHRTVMAITAIVMGFAGTDFASAAPEDGSRAFRACVACHSLEPDQHLTGPSLAGLYGRKAGTIDGFTRYSSALKNADVVWNDENLDTWLANPQALIPGNLMSFPGIKEKQVRADLIAFLKEVGAEGVDQQTTSQRGMMRGPSLQDLKRLGPTQQVVSLRYCGDTYYVTTADDRLIPLWEFNLRFKTDSTDKGPPRGHPVLLQASMMGDRAFIIFADPAEISPFIDKEC